MTDVYSVKSEVEAFTVTKAQGRSSAGKRDQKKDKL